MSVHTMGAAILGIPELMIEKKEAATLAEAIANVSQYYDIPADPKTMAWVNLTVAGFAIYGTRTLAYTNRIRRETMEARARLAAPAPAQPQPPPVARPGAPRANGAAAVPPDLVSHLGQPAVGDA